MYEGFLHGPFQLFMYFPSLPSKPMPKLSFSIFPIFIFIFKVNFWSFFISAKLAVKFHFCNSLGLSVRRNANLLATVEDISNAIMTVVTKDAPTFLWCCKFETIVTNVTSLTIAAAAVSFPSGPGYPVLGGFSRGTDSISPIRYLLSFSYMSMFVDKHVILLWLEKYNWNQKLWALLRNLIFFF